MARKKKSTASGGNNNNNKSGSKSTKGNTNTTTNSTTASHTDMNVTVHTELIAKAGAAKDKLLGAIDQGTSSTRFLVFSANKQSTTVLASAQLEHVQLYPQPGWHEHDPVVLWHNTAACMAAVQAAWPTTPDTPLSLAAIGLTNQRETLVAWNRRTGQPYYNAIVWDDARTQAACETDYTKDVCEQLTNTTGLPMSSYFCGTKVKWLLEHVEALAQDVKDRPTEVCFGTVDTWLLHQLTGQVPKSESGRKLKGDKILNTGGSFQTDVTNASRWLFMDLDTCQWDEACVKAVLCESSSSSSCTTLPLSCLPDIQPSGGNFGSVADCGLHAVYHGVPLAAVLGDQQAALFGQACFEPGDTKCTYGTGLFLMRQTGSQRITSKHGLLTTVAYQMKDDKVVYALEGSVSHSGATIQWLRDQLQLISTAAESESWAKKVSGNEGVYLVPAFAGLFAPHWRSDARACLVGLEAFHNKGHVCRAALEAAAYQASELLTAMEQDTVDGSSSGSAEKTPLRVDGGGTQNRFLLQFQADILNASVVQPVVLETTCRGAALCAGLAVGVYDSLEEIGASWAAAQTFAPKMSDAERTKNVLGWNKAVTKSLGWLENSSSSTPAAEASSGKPTASVDVSAKPSTEKTLGAVAGDVESSPEVNNVDLPTSPATYVGDVDEASVSAPSQTTATVRSRNASVTATTKDAQQPSNGTPSSSSNPLRSGSYSTTTLALVTGVALGVGVLVGSARKR